MSAKIRSLQAKKAEHVKNARALTDAAAAQARDLSAEEQQQFDEHAAQIASLNAAIDREQLLATEEAGLQAAGGGVQLPAQATITVTDNVAADPKRGFKTFGEFAQSVRNAGQAGARPDQRLLIGAAAPTTYGNEGAGVDGGYLVPPEYASEIFSYSFTEDALLPAVDNTTVSGNSMVFPKDETTPWGTDGVRAYWQAEANSATQTKPKFGTSALRLHKLMSLVPLTDELVADQSALNSYLPSLLGRSIRWKTNESILFGSGAGQPQGAFNSGAVVTVAKDSGQQANTVSIGNVTNMIARLLPGSFPRAMWMITPDALPSLFQLTLGNYPIYLPVGNGQGGAQGSPYGTLLGRPIVVSQHAAAFSAQGDILLMDPTYYRAITKAGGVQMDSSMHLYFDADATAFRAIFRVDGQPKIAAPVSQAKGSNTLSPFVQLGAR